MNNDLTVSGLAYMWNWSDKDNGSLRTEIARGASLPTELRIQHGPYIDSKTKRPGIRTLVRLDHHMAMTDGIIAPVSMYVVFARPTDPLVTAAIATALEAQLVNLLHGTTNTSGLDLEGEIFSGRQQ